MAIFAEGASDDRGGSRRIAAICGSRQSADRGNPQIA